VEFLLGSNNRQHQFGPDLGLEKASIAVNLRSGRDGLGLSLSPSKHGY
jgi:hypothetical protein